MFRTIFVLVLLAGAAFMAGWFTVHRDDNQTTIRINRDEIKSDASKAIAKGRDFLNKTNQANGQSVDGQGVNGQFVAQPQNGQFQNGQFQNGQFQNGQFTGGQFSNGQIPPQPPNNFQGAPVGYPVPPANFQGNYQGGNFQQPPANYNNQQANRPTPPWQTPPSSQQF